MKVVLLANHSAILPVIDYLHSQGWLTAVVSTEKLHSHHLQIENISRQYNIPFYKINRQELNTALTDIFNVLKPDLAIMCGFSYRIPSQVFNIPSLGFFNIHFSLLPAYKGPDPIFWQIKNGEQTGGISIHNIDHDFDTGEIILQQPISFMPGESWGICNSRYTQVLFNMILQLISNLGEGKLLTPLETAGKQGSYYPNPEADDLAIKWDILTTEQIENLVNASNPNAGGAISYLNQQLVRILEVSPVEGKGDPHTPAGTIIHADASGLYVQCLESNLLRINILKLNEGFITGFKLAALGVKKGDRFENSVSQYQVFSN